MDLDTKSKKFRWLRLRWISSLLVAVCLLAFPFAAEALGDMGPAAKDAVPLLQAMLNDRQSALAQAASEALNKITKSP